MFHAKRLALVAALPLFLFACVGALLIAAADPARAGPDIDGSDRGIRRRRLVAQLETQHGIHGEQEHAERRSDYPPWHVMRQRTITLAHSRPMRRQRPLELTTLLTNVAVKLLTNAFTLIIKEF